MFTFLEKRVTRFYRLTKLTFTCSKSTVETLEKGVKMFKINDENKTSTPEIIRKPSVF